jgi:ribonuclease J
MRITIHRGIDQIGGCITEIATDRTRIMIDLGQNLPDGEGVVCDGFATKEAVEKLTQGVDAIFYTHYHGDHIGLFHLVPDGVPQYIGKVAKQVALCKHRKLAQIPFRQELSNDELAGLQKMGELSSWQTVKVGDIVVTPYLVSHSAYDSYMFLIEADGKKVLHTGDFRGHGYLSKGFTQRIERIGSIDFLITEGTMLSRLDEQVMSEYVLQKRAKKIMSQYKNVFVMCSSTDMERLASFQEANKQMHRPLVCDGFQSEVLKIFSETAGVYSSFFKFDGIYDFRPTNTKLLNWMADTGFCMFVRATDKFKEWYQILSSRLDPNETVVIYSMWKEYINPNGKYIMPRYAEFVSMFPNLEKLHTSGHASPEFLVQICSQVNPSLGIIPIHSNNSAAFAYLPIGESLQQRVITTSTMIDDVDVIIRELSLDCRNHRN